MRRWFAFGLCLAACEEKKPTPPVTATAQPVAASLPASQPVAQPGSQPAGEPACPADEPELYLRAEMNAEDAALFKVQWEDSKPFGGKCCKGHVVDRVHSETVDVCALAGGKIKGRKLKVLWVHWSNADCVHEPKKGEAGVEIVLFDANNEVVGTNSTLTDTYSDNSLAPGETKATIETGRQLIAPGAFVLSTTTRKEPAEEANEENGVRTTEVAGYCLVGTDLEELFSFEIANEQGSPDGSAESNCSWQFTKQKTQAMPNVVRVCKEAVISEEGTQKNTTKTTWIFNGKTYDEK